MDSKVALDLLLTQISFELLGNAFYDISGVQKDKIMDLFKTVPNSDLANSSKECCDLMKFIGYENVNALAEDSTCEKFSSEMLDTIMANNGYQGDDIDETMEIQNYINKKTNLEKNVFLMDSVELSIKQTNERKKLVADFDTEFNNEVKKGRTPEEKDEIAKKYFQQEKESLLADTTKTLNLLNHILEDPQNAHKRREILASIEIFKRSNLQQKEDEATGS